MEVKCPICIFPIKSEENAVLPCSHELCLKCVEELKQYSNKCPLCLKEFMTYKQSNDNVVHELKESDFAAIEEQKKKYSQEEQFDCITREDVKVQIKEYKQMADSLSLRLFSRSSIDRGNDKEQALLESIYSHLIEIDDYLYLEEFDGSSIMSILNEVIINIKDLKTRKYKEHIEQEEINGEGLQTYYSIQYIPNGNKNNKKKKRK